MDVNEHMGYDISSPTSWEIMIDNHMLGYLVDNPKLHMERWEDHLPEPRFFLAVGGVVGHKRMHLYIYICI